MHDSIVVEEHRRLHLEPGAVVFTEGDDGDCAYYVQSGMIEVSRRLGSAEVVIATEREGGIIGEMALIDNKPRSATARAVEQTVLICVPKTEFERYLNGTDPLIRSLLERFVAIIRTMTTENIRLILGIR